MRNTFIIIILISVLFSCTKENVKESLQYKVNDLFINYKESKKIANLVITQINHSSQNSMINIKNMQFIKSKDCNNDTLIYAYNYENGFVIVSGSKSIFPILAYSKEGNIDLNNSNNYGFSLWLETVIANIKDSKEINTANSLELYNSFIIELERNNLIYNGQNTNKGGITITYHKQEGPLLSTSWGQGSPFNNYCPIVTNSQYTNGRAPAGCVPIAIAQVINYYKRFDNENIDWAKIQNNDNNELASFLIKIGNGIIMTYNANYSHPYINYANPFDYRNRISNYLGSKGYNVSFNNDNTLTQHNNNIPFIAEGFKSNVFNGTNWFNGHWWVCDGYEITHYNVGSGSEGPLMKNNKRDFSSYSTHFLHFNWGWNGSMNGWFGCSTSYNDYSKSFKRISINSK